MRRINIGRIVMALSIGVVINVLVAWSPSTNGWNNQPIAGSRRYWTLPPHTPWPTTPPAGWPSTPDRASRGRGFRSESFGFYAFVPSVHSDDDDRPLGAHYLMYAESTGWPMGSLMLFYGRKYYNDIGEIPNFGLLRRGWLLPPSWQSLRFGTTVPLPLMPLWPGFAINTLFYGTFAFAAMAGVPAIKRRRRFKRGLCVQCAYPRTGGDICPECGTAVASAAKSPAPAAEPAGSTPV